jgi:hypothetical protein
MTTTADTKQQLIEALDGLDEERLADVLEFIRTGRVRPRGIPGKELAAFVSQLPDLSEEEIQQMDDILREIREMDMLRGV